MHITREPGTYVYKISRSRCARIYEPMKFLDFHNLRGQLKGAQIPKNQLFTRQPPTNRRQHFHFGCLKHKLKSRFMILARFARLRRANLSVLSRSTVYLSCRLSFFGQIFTPLGAQIDSKCVKIQLFSSILILITHNARSALTGTPNKDPAPSPPRPHAKPDSARRPPRRKVAPVCAPFNSPRGLCTPIFIKIQHNSAVLYIHLFGDVAAAKS